MTTHHQSQLFALKTKPTPIPQWKSAPNLWLTKLPNATAGKIAEKFIMNLVGGTKAPKGSTFDVSAYGQKLEVKLCRRSYSATNSWSWKQIRPNDAWNWMWLVAVEPSDTNVYAVPKSVLLVTGRLSNQHGQKNKTGVLMQLRFKSVPNWLQPYKIP